MAAKKSSSKEQFDEQGNLLFRVFDTIKVRVETTVEFPLDIKCTLMFTEEDLEEFNQLRAHQYA